jgi:hypothetical protein
LGRENQVVRQDYRVFYDDESRELVANRFARTIELFDYRFDGYEWIPKKGSGFE